MLSISTTSEPSQSCNRMDQAGRTHFVGHCRHLHTNTHTYLHLCACKPAWGRASEKMLPISQHGTCSGAPHRGLRARQSLTEIMVTSLQVYESAHAEKHSCPLLLHGSECVCAYLAVRVYAERQVGESKDLITHNVLFLCPFFFYFAPTRAELQSPPLVFASQYRTLCCVRFYTYCIVCLLFFPFPLPAHGWLFTVHVWHQKAVWTATIPSEWRGMFLLEDPTEAWTELILNYELAGDYSHLCSFSLFFLAFFPSLSTFLTLIKMC